MKKTSIKQLGAFLDNLRSKQKIEIEHVCRSLGINEEAFHKFTKDEVQLNLIQLTQYTNLLGTTINETLSELKIVSSPNKINLHKNITSPVPSPSESRDNENLFELALIKDRKLYFVPITGCFKQDYIKVDQEITKIFRQLNEPKREIKNRDAIFEALCFAVDSLPNVNPSDIYHHIVYRIYLREYITNSPSQSWVRAGGEAVELFIKNRYENHLKKHGISIRIAFQEGKRNSFLEDMGLSTKVPGKSKLDIGLYGELNNSQIPFGGIHSKASLAERVSDDKPCSEIMMQAGYASYLFTFDAKSFPPPSGNLINNGELGTPNAPSDKRNYIEEYGSFSACFSYNTNTTPSPKLTNSGKKIYTLNSFTPNDAFVKKVVSDWHIFKNTKQHP